MLDRLHDTQLNFSGSGGTNDFGHTIHSFTVEFYSSSGGPMLVRLPLVYYRNSNSNCLKLNRLWVHSVTITIHVARLNFKTSHVGVYKCPSLIVAIWQREVVSCGDLISCAVTTFWNLPWQGLCLLMTPTLCTLSSPLKLSIDKLRWQTHIDKLPKKFASGIGATYRLMLLVNLNSIIIAILSGVIVVKVYLTGDRTMLLVF